MSTETVEFDTFQRTFSMMAGHLLVLPFFHTHNSDVYHVGSRWNFTASETDLVRIFLFRIDPGTQINFTCIIKSNVNNRVVVRTGDFRNKGVQSEPLLVFDPKELLSLSELVITYGIVINASQETETLSRKFISCSVQTEDTNSVIGNENPKDEDWSSIDMKDDTLFRERMKELLTKGIDHDVTICVKDKQYRAHRNILSTRSPVFAMMLTHDSKEKNTGVIEIEDCDPESFYEFLLYVYSGRTENLTPSNAVQLYYSADKYDFPVLKERCVKILKHSLSVESICDVVLLASKHLEKELLEVATEFFARNMKKILVTVSWQKFLSQNLVVANELLIKSTEIINPEK